MKEDEHLVNEGPSFMRDLWHGITSTASAMGKTASDKLDAAQELLKKNIGIESIKTYVLAFCGSKLANNVSLKTIAMNEDPAGTDSAELTFSCLITVK